MSYDFRVNASATDDTVAIASASATATSLSGATRVVLIARTADGCAIKWGASDVVAATASNFPIIADNYLVFDVPPGITHFRIIRIGSTNGTLHWAQVA